MITFVLGGTRSGKSHIAEDLAAKAAGTLAPGVVPATGTPVTYIATARLDPGDPDHRGRIDAHRARRPAEWATRECASVDDLVAHLATAPGVVLVDSLGTWVTLDPELAPDPNPLVAALAARTAPTVVVSEEVGLAVHPPSELGRRYVDAVGSVNQAVAEVAGRVLLVVAGRVLDLDRWESG